ncbi:TIGR03862 family flavoprotein [Tahibacter amnicola]|uniref:TIGR03862 family flavoprotein n=1 Tax=Tahibacter amnicola TaxID=2976241 RepID=A0ABY6BK01_9GAMM|nr:TIGR03862 family flavoprotein [Tahibacter amnicola]UXI69931.1 TIGR03862 family flavoprotein [Tahibacter amnicola]
MPMPSSSSVVVIGGGPAGLMAAEAAADAGCPVHLYDAMGSVGRKFLLAGKGGLNLTHSESFAPFVARFGARSDAVAAWLREFDAPALREWARGLGVETFVGTSGRVFPVDLKAAPLLRAWVRRLRERGVTFHVNHRWEGWNADGTVRLQPREGAAVAVAADALVLALGGASWPVLGSDGRWFPLLADRGIPLAPLKPANCGFEVPWSEHFRSRHAGDPVKPVTLRWVGLQGPQTRQGEMVISEYGVEGSLIYAASAAIRDQIDAQGPTAVTLDLAPAKTASRIAQDLAKPRGKRSLSEHLRRHAGIDGVKAGLLYEVLDRAAMNDPATLAKAIKALPLTLHRPRPVAEAISTAGGVALEGLDADLMLRDMPGVFCAGEMLDWEAPTGGYLLTASFASGRIAGRAAARWARRPE